MIKKYLTGAVVAVGMIAGATVANATTMYFGTGNGTAGTNSYTFIGDGVTAVATPLSTSSNSTIHQYSRGLGVSSGYNDNHEVDGANGDEAVRVTFDQEVTLETIYFSYVGTNDDFSYRVDSGSWSQNFDIVGGNYNDTGNGYFNFSLPGILGTVFDIAAFNSNDDFKVRGMEFSAVSAVPLPPAVLMFGAALLGLGWVKRRKQAA